MNSLSRIPFGTKIIIDTNILIYFALAHGKFGPSCKEFMLRIQRGEISGFIPTIVLNELVHSLMMAELIEKGCGKNRSEVIQYVKRVSLHNNERNHHPAVKNNESGIGSVKSLIAETWNWIDKISDLNCTIIHETNSTIYHSFFYSKEFGLLAKDAYIAAFAKTHDISNIATNDADFDTLPELNSWKPDVVID